MMPQELFCVPSNLGLGSSLVQVSDPNPNSNPPKRKRSLPGTPDPDAEVIALSPKSLMTSNRFICEICNKGFQREQNLQLHRRGHNLPWKLRQRKKEEAVRKKVYVCPEKTCVHHHPTRALGDLTGIKKHYSRKHGEKKWKCTKCTKKYAVQSDWKAHTKICGTRDYTCHCGTLFSRKDSFITHRAFCGAWGEVPTALSNLRNDHWMNSTRAQEGRVNDVSGSLVGLQGARTLMGAGIGENKVRVPAAWSSCQLNPLPLGGNDVVHTFESALAVENYRFPVPEASASANNVWVTQGLKHERENENPQVPVHGFNNLNVYEQQLGMGFTRDFLGAAVADETLSFLAKFNPMPPLINLQTHYANP